MNFLKKAQQQASNIQGTKPTVPGAKPTVPGVKPTVPGAKPAIPGAKPSIPGAKPTIPGKKPGLPKPEATEEATPLASKENPFLKNKTKTNVETKAEEIAKDLDIPDVDVEEVSDANVNPEPVAEVKAKSKPEVKVEAKVETKAETETEVEVEEVVETPITEEASIAEPIEEVVEEKPKKKASRSRAKKTTAKKAEVEVETTDISVNEEAPVAPVINVMVKTETDFAGAVDSIKSSFVDEEWEAFRADVIERLNDINISSDMNTVALRATVADLVALRESIWVQYNDTKSIFEKLTAKEPEGLIERIKKLNSKGSNDAERKTNAINAVINYKDESGRRINLFELLDETRERYNFLRSVMDTSQYKTNVLVTMLGGLKLEK